MKRKYRILALMMALVILVATFAGCNGSNNPPSSTGSTGSEGKDDGNDSTPSGEEKVVVFWTHYSDDIAFTQKKVADYNELMAGQVKVELKHISDDYNNVLLMALKNDDGPDLYANGVDLAQLAQQNYMAPLDDLMSDEMAARVADFRQNAINWYDGSWYSLPFRGYNFRLAWNKDMFEAAGLDPDSPPTTYEELIEYAQILTEYGSAQSPQQYGFMLPTGEDWIWWIYGMQMARVNGDSYYDYTTGEFTWEAFKPVMEMYLTLKENNSLFPGGTTMENDPARAQFSAGNVGMIIAASWDIGVFNDQFPAEIEWDVAELPNIDGERHGYPQLDAGSYLHINAGSSVKQEAMDFYEYLLSEEVLIEYYEEGYGIPVYDGIAQKASKTPDRSGFAGFADVSNDRMYAYEPPVQVEGQGYGSVMNDVMNGAVDIDTAIADLNARYNAAIEAGVANGDFAIEDYIIPGYSTLNPLGN